MLLVQRGLHNQKGKKELPVHRVELAQQAHKVQPVPKVLLAHKVLKALKVLLAHKVEKVKKVKPA